MDRKKVVRSFFPGANFIDREDFCKERDEDVTYIKATKLCSIAEKWTIA